MFWRLPATWRPGPLAARPSHRESFRVRSAPPSPGRPPRVLGQNARARRRPGICGPARARRAPARPRRGGSRCPLRAPPVPRPRARELTWFASRNVPVHLLANCSCPRGTHPPPRRPVSHRSMSITDTLRRARRQREQNARADGAAPRGQAPRWNSPWQGRVSSPRARERARGTTAARLMGNVRAATTAGFATGPFPRVFRPRVFPFHSRPQPTYGWYPRGRRRAQLSPTRRSRCGR